MWSSTPLHESRKARLTGWIEHPIDGESDLPESVIRIIRSWQLDYVVAATESSVIPAAKLRAEFGLPGTPLIVAMLAHDKFVMKTKAKEYNIPITNFHLVQNEDDAAFLTQKLGLPLVLKPVDESGATDVKVLEDIAAVTQAMRPGLLAEAFVKGPEVSVETFIKDGQTIFHNITDYLHPWQKSIAPASLDESLSNSIRAINDQVINAFGITNGMTHAEFYLTEEGPIFGEIALRPPGGYYMDIIDKAYGFDTWETYIAIETESVVGNLPDNARRYAAVYIIHAGKGGVVTSILGADILAKLPGVFECQLDLTVGEVVVDRVNTSNEHGHLLMAAKSRNELLSLIQRIEQEFSVTVKTINHEG
ncbi:MAG: biotin carboxylase [Granulosicoccus sp.]